MKISVQKYPLIEDLGVELAVVPIDAMVVWMLPHTIAAKIWLVQAMKDLGYDEKELDLWMPKWNATFFVGVNNAQVLLTHPEVPKFGLARLDELRAQTPTKEDAAIISPLEG